MIPKIFSYVISDFEPTPQDKSIRVHKIHMHTKWVWINSLYNWLFVCVYIYVCKCAHTHTHTYVYILFTQISCGFLLHELPELLTWIHVLLSQCLTTKTGVIYLPPQVPDFWSFCCAFKFFFLIILQILLGWSLTRHSNGAFLPDLLEMKESKICFGEIYA